MSTVELPGSASPGKEKFANTTEYQLVKKEEAARLKRAQLAAAQEFWEPVLNDATRTHALVVAWRRIDSMLPAVFEAPGLTAFRLIGCGVEDLPDAFGEQHHSIEQVNLSSNELTTLPDSMRNLRGMVELNVMKNKLVELPPFFGVLTSLRELYASGNQLRELPPALGMLPHLQKLVLDSNQLTELPDTMDGMTGLEYLSLDDNRFIKLPDWMGQLRSLRTLSVNRNRLAIFPHQLFTCSYLQSLSLCSNRISFLPDSIGRFPSLRDLRLDWNRIEFLPDTFKLLTGLQLLKLEGNPLKRPPLAFIVAKGPKGLLAWGQGEASSVLSRRSKAAVEMFQQVCKVAAREGLARATVLTSDSVLEFEGERDSYYAIDWDRFFKEVWPRARDLWQLRRLPVIGEKTREQADAEEAKRLAEEAEEMRRFEEEEAALARGEAKESLEDGKLVRVNGGAGEEEEEEEEGKDGDDGDDDDGHVDWVGAWSAKREAVGQAGIAEAKAAADAADYAALEEPGTFWRRPVAELEAILTAYRDATGIIFRKDVKARFRECDCVDPANPAMSKPCVPPANGWMCEKACAVLKMKLLSRVDKEGKQQDAWEVAAIEAAATAAKKMAQEYIASEEGRAALTRSAIQAAYAEEDAERREAFNAAVVVAHRPDLQKIRRKYATRRSKETKRITELIARLSEKKAYVDSQLKDLDMWQRQALEDELLQLRRRLGAGQATSLAGAAAVDGASKAQQAALATAMIMESGNGVAGMPLDVLTRQLDRDKLGGTDHIWVRKTKEGSMLPANAAASRAEDERRAAQLEAELRGLTESEKADLRKELARVTAMLEKAQKDDVVQRITEEEEAAIEQLHDKVRSVQAKYKPLTGWAHAIAVVLDGKAHRARVDKHFALLAAAHISRCVAEGEEAAQKSFALMRKITAKWKSSGVRAIFAAWKTYTRNSRMMRSGAKSAAGGAGGGSGGGAGGAGGGVRMLTNG